MANYYEVQDKKNKKIKNLIIYFIIIFLLISLFIPYMIYYIYALLYPLSRLDGSALKFSLDVGLMYAIINFIGFALSYYFLSSQSGEKIAKFLDARKITDKKGNYIKHQAYSTISNLAFKEKQLCNIIVEMSIASGLSKIPEVYVMDMELSINAMCAGFQNGKIAIIVTKGALLAFNREQMQGVIGHEFSHAVNEDIRLNVKVISIILGLTAIVFIGENLIRGLIKARMFGGTEQLIKKICIVGSIYYLIGFIGIIFSNLIQSNISMQRKYFADAKSIQYTSNKEGLIQALEIIRDNGKNGANGGYIKNLNSKIISHMFFVSPNYEIFETHPSVEKRIAALQYLG